MIYSITILGGGNAGLMSALYIKKSFPNVKVTVIKSTNIGTIGVGEGSTEHWGRFAKAVGITLQDLVKECDATIKIGIKFENWHGDGSSYFHSIPEYFTNMDTYTGAPHSLLRSIVYDQSESLHWDYPMQGFVKDPLNDYSQFHFDSEKLNQFFEKKCLDNNISIKVADIVNVTLNDQGYVESLIDTDGIKHPADFFIDSSGFNRVIAKHLGASWIDWSKYLPLNSAIAFQTPSQETIPTYTLAKALDCGWHWRSPVQNRFGNGYVFSDHFTNENSAYDEIQKYFADAVNIGRKIKFISGKVNKAWIKNCVCIGLSSNFVEPLEASSLSATIRQLQLLSAGLWNWNKHDTNTVNEYNRLFDDMMFNVLDFIQLHYLTQRTDTDFWRWCKNEMTLTDFNAANIKDFQTNFVNQLILPEDGIFSNYRIYDCLNWIQIMHGLRLFNIPALRKLYESHYDKTFTQQDIDHISKIKDYEHNWIPHKEALKILKTQIHTGIYHG